MDAGDLSARRTTDQSFEDSPAPLLWLYLWRAETAATHVLSAQWPDRSVMAAAHCTRHVRFLPVFASTGAPVRVTVAYMPS